MELFTIKDASFFKLFQHYSCVHQRVKGRGRKASEAMKHKGALKLYFREG